MVALDEARRDDPDHARMPVLAREYVRSALPARRRAQRRELAFGVGEDAQLGLAPLVVGAVELGRDLMGARGVPGEQQLQAGVRAVQASCRVQAGRQSESDSALIDGTDPARPR